MTDLPAAPLSYCSTDGDTGPMEKWNRDALVSLQGELKLNVMIKTGLVNKLQKAAGGFMSDAEAQAVMSKPSNAEQMGELIQILLGKTNQDFKVFCRMLRQSDYHVWANELEKKAREFKGEPGTLILIYVEGKNLGLASFCLHLFLCHFWLCTQMGHHPSQSHLVLMS